MLSVGKLAMRLCCWFLLLSRVRPINMRALVVRCCRSPCRLIPRLIIWSMLKSRWALTRLSVTRLATRRCCCALALTVRLVFILSRLTTCRPVWILMMLTRCRGRFVNMVRLVPLLWRLIRCCLKVSVRRVRVLLNVRRFRAK